MHTEARTVSNQVVKISDFISKFTISVASHQFDILRSFLFFLISSRKYGDIRTQVKTVFEILVHSICVSYIIYTGWK
jgi:hypothetical protein